MVEEKKISKNNSFVIPKVSRYDYIRIIRWAGLVAHMYIVIQNQPIDGTKHLWIFGRKDQYQSGSWRYEVRKYERNLSKWGDFWVSAVVLRILDRMNRGVKLPETSEYTHCFIRLAHHSLMKIVTLSCR